MIKYLKKYICWFFNPFQSEWNWYIAEGWYWSEKRGFMPYLHPRLNVMIDSRETHNWVGRILNGGNYDLGIMTKIRQYAALNHSDLEMDCQEKAILAAVLFAIKTEPQRWPVFIHYTQEQLAARDKAWSEAADSFWDLDYVITSKLTEHQKRLKENENVKMLNDFLKNRN